MRLFPAVIVTTSSSPIPPLPSPIFHPYFPGGPSIIPFDFSEKLTPPLPRIIPNLTLLFHLVKTFYSFFRDRHSQFQYNSPTPKTLLLAPVPTILTFTRITRAPKSVQSFQSYCFIQLSHFNPVLEVVTALKCYRLSILLITNFLGSVTGAPSPHSSL